MNTLGMLGITLAALALFTAAAWRLWPEAQDAQATLAAHNYVVLRNAANEAAFADKTITSSTVRSVAVTDASLTPFLPSSWSTLSQNGQARWKIRIQNGMCYVYGAVSTAEIAAVRKLMRYTPTLAWYVGGTLIPPIKNQQPDGTLQPVTLPADLAAGSVLSVVKVVP